MPERKTLFEKLMPWLAIAVLIYCLMLGVYGNLGAMSISSVLF